FNNPVAYPLVNITMPLTDVYARTRTGRNPSSFRGQTPNMGGYALGRGFRLPCLAMFKIHTAAGDYIIPTISCHYGAVRGGRNHLALGQIAQLKDLQISQLFNDIAAPAPPGALGNSHTINISGTQTQ